MSGLDCGERLDRGSPELWPEQVPGVSEFTRSLGGPRVAPAVLSGRYRTELDAEDIRLVNEMGQLSADALMDHIRRLQNQSYTMGIEEAKQLSRGKFLQVLEKPTSKW